MNYQNVVCGNYSYYLFSFDYFLKSMDNLGVENIELWGAGPHLYQDECNPAMVDELYKKVRLHNKKVVCYTPEQCMYPINIASRESIVRDRSIAYLKRSLEIANQLEASRTLITVGQGYRNESREEAWKRCVDALLELGEYAGKMGTKIMLEHLTKTTTNLCVTAKELKAMMDEVGGTNVKAMVDVDMAARVGEGAKEYLELMGKDIQHVHFIDGMPGGHLALGDGILPLDTYLNDLKAFGYDGYLSLEILSDRYHENPELAYAQSLGWFRARGL
ncbi:MAG: sugar phosphate isomerase/epimerase [Herbinix sp.]|nr:sugar phosphate isomerase/epimerase [Herbinix sp.]